MHDEEDHGVTMQDIFQDKALHLSTRAENHVVLLLSIMQALWMRKKMLCI
jgi:hypothetical protein